MCWKNQVTLYRHLEFVHPWHKANTLYVCNTQNLKYIQSFWDPWTIKPHATARIVVVLNWPLSLLWNQEKEVKTKLLVQNLQTTGTTLTLYITLVILCTNKVSIHLVYVLSIECIHVFCMNLRINSGFNWYNINWGGYINETECVDCLIQGINHSLHYTYVYIVYDNCIILNRYYDIICDNFHIVWFCTSVWYMENKMNEWMNELHRQNTLRVGFTIILMHPAVIKLTYVRSCQCI